MVASHGLPATAALLVLAAAALLCPVRAAPAAPTSGWLAGSATFDDAGVASDGSCGAPLPAWADGGVAISPNSSLAGPSRDGCGSCIELACKDCGLPNGTSLQLVVTDTCTSCSALQLNLSPDTFARLAPLSSGLAPIHFRTVECAPPLGSNITVVVDAWRTSEGGWLRLAVSNVGGPGLASVELRQAPLAASNSLVLQALVWRRLASTHGAQFEMNGLPAPPLDLRFTSSGSETLIARRVLTDPSVLGAPIDTNVQFQPSAGRGTTPAALPPILLAAPAPGGATNASLAAAVGSPAPTTALASPAPVTKVTLLAALASPAPQPEDEPAPGPCNATLLDALDANFSIWRALVHSAAPTNDAIMASTDQVSAWRFDDALLTRTVLGHLIPGKRTVASFTQTTDVDAIGGGTLHIVPRAGQLLVVSGNSSAIAKGALDACTSTVHPISRVLFVE
eukprot:scaffold3.g6304.t1